MSGDKKQVVVISPMSTRRRQIRRTLDKISEAQLAGEGETSGEACFEARQATKIHVVVVDLSHSDSSMPSFWIEIHLAFPAAHLLVILDKPITEATLQMALLAGVCGFVLREHVPKALRRALAEVCAGRSFYSSPQLILIVTRLTYQWATDNQTTIPTSHLPNVYELTAVDKLNGLTRSEQVVLRWLAKGLSNKEIAEKLGVSQKTVKNRMSDILGKLGARNRTEAALWAREHGLEGE